MKIPILDQNGQVESDMEVRFPLIENGKGTQAVHDAVVAYRAAQRSGTACTKNVGEVAGTNKKPWRQKGTGRARAGSFQSPLWRGGGVVFGPKPRDFTKKVSKKTRQLAFRKALSERLKEGAVRIVKDWNLTTPKTKEFVSALSKLGLSGSTLIVHSEPGKHLLLAARNVPQVEVVSAESLNVYQVLRFQNIIFAASSFEKTQEKIIREGV